MICIGTLRHPLKFSEWCPHDCIHQYHKQKHSIMSSSDDPYSRQNQAPSSLKKTFNIFKMITCSEGHERLRTCPTWPSLPLSGVGCHSHLVLMYDVPVKLSAHSLIHIHVYKTSYPTSQRTCGGHAERPQIRPKSPGLDLLKNVNQWFRG